TSVKAGGYSLNHTQAALVVRTSVRAGGVNLSNHAQAAVVVRTGVKAGGTKYQHAQAVAVRTGTRAGRLAMNHAHAAVVVRPLRRTPRRSDGEKGRPSRSAGSFRRPRWTRPGPSACG